jgi:Fe-S oxidoreductase
VHPRAHYSMGLIWWWSRLASIAPRFANAMSHARLLGSLVKVAGGIAQERELPRFAHTTFRSWFKNRRALAARGERVILWPDTFNNFFQPEVGVAAVEVLEAAGYRVEVPDAMLCCGRPLYAAGFVSRAQKLLRRILDALEPAIDAGVPLVGLEPACVSAFRDELPNLFPDDERARRLAKQTFILGEFLLEQDYQPPPLDRQALVHFHCNHHAVLKTRADKGILDRMGLDFRVLNSGCCGMAGSFGFEAEHYDVSIKCGERVLLPAVRGASPDTLIITDGFSCREQIAQCTGRDALHLAQVLRMALREGRGIRARLPQHAGAGA